MMMMTTTTTSLLRSLSVFVTFSVATQSFHINLPILHCNHRPRQCVALQQTAYDGHSQDECGKRGFPQPTRRDMLVQTAGLTLSSLLIGSCRVGNNPAVASAATPQTIVMTGANSGIGFESCKRLASQGHDIVLACRTMEKAQDAIQRIRQAGVETGTLNPAACDLSSLESIKSFADSLAVSKIDALCLNAGIARNAGATDIIRTVDGFELTGTCCHRVLFYRYSTNIY